MRELEGRVAVITGGSRGIGAGLARGFQERGLRVAVCARTDPDPGELPEGGNVLFGRADVTDPLSLESFARLARKRLGPIDLWVNNAGVLEPIGMLRSVAPGDFAGSLAVNVAGVHAGTRAFLTLCHEEGRKGTLVNISSGAATAPYEGWGAYCAGKAAVDMLSRVTALEEAPHGIRVFSLAPGIIETAMQRLIRSQSEEDFPAVEKFRQLEAEGQMLDPEFPVPAILRLAFGDPLPPESVVLDTRGSPELSGLDW